MPGPAARHLFGFWGGAVVDRADRKTIFVVTQAAGGLLTIGLVAYVALYGPQLR